MNMNVMMMMIMAMRRKKISRAVNTSTFLLLLIVLSTVLLPSGHGFHLGNSFLPTEVRNRPTSTSTQLHFFFADKEEPAADATASPKNKARAVNDNLKSTKPKPKPKPSTISSPTTTLERYKNDQIPSFSFNPLYGIAWICLVIFAFSDNLAPGSIGAPQDATMFQAILDNPLHPHGINELFYCIFNLFAVIPILLANIFIPQARQDKGLPAWPFLLASSAIGYFSIGIYLTLRAPPKQVYYSSTTDVTDNVSWFMRNVLENKTLNWILVAFTLYLPFGTHVVEQLLTNPQELWQGFVEIVTTSRVAAISTIDLTLLYASAVAGTGCDYRLRQPNATDQQVMQVVAASALVPLLGTAIYCAWRPSLLLAPPNLVAKNR